mgnify:CR=1 FL=1
MQNPEITKTTLEIRDEIRNIIQNGKTQSGAIRGLLGYFQQNAQMGNFQTALDIAITELAEYSQERGN